MPDSPELKIVTTQEVSNMDKKYISARVQSWIDEEDMPVNGALKPLRKFDGLYPEDPDEAEAYWDWIRFHLGRSEEDLKDIKNPKNPVRYWKTVMKLERAKARTRVAWGRE